MLTHFDSDRTQHSSSAGQAAMPALRSNGLVAGQAAAGEPGSGAYSEEALVRRWRGGDRAAASELVRACRPLLRAFFRRRTANNVDELMQRTLVACVQSLGRFEGRSSFRSFLLGIAHRQFLMSLRAERPRPMPASLAASDAACPSQLLASKEDVHQVARALNDTAPPFRRVLEMFYWDDLSVEQIARALGLPVGTVKSRLARGRSMIRARLVASASDECRAHGSDRRRAQGACGSSSRLRRVQLGVRFSPDVTVGVSHGAW